MHALLIDEGDEHMCSMTLIGFAFISCFVHPQEASDTFAAVQVCGGRGLSEEGYVAVVNGWKNRSKSSSDQATLVMASWHDTYSCRRSKRVVETSSESNEVEIVFVRPYPIPCITHTLSDCASVWHSHHTFDLARVAQSRSFSDYQVAQAVNPSLSGNVRTPCHHHLLSFRPKVSYRSYGES